MAGMFQAWVDMWRPLYHKIEVHYEPWNSSYVAGVSEMEALIFARREDIYRALTDGALWTVCFPITVVYLTMIAALQKLMESRARFHLRNQMIVWNLMLAAFSALVVYRVAPEFIDLFVSHDWPTGFYRSVCTTRSIKSHVGVWFFLFGCSKVVELGDTVFLVLKKRRLIFLHYSHHIITMLYCFYTLVDWYSVTRWFLLVNSAVHTVMYGYFAAKAAGWSVPGWLSITITVSQLSQMVLGLYINYRAFTFLKSGVYCEATYRNVYMCFAMYSLYVVLFGHFFLTSYVLKGAAKQHDGRKVDVRSGINRQTASCCDDNNKVKDE